VKRIRDKVAGLDVHRDTVVACARIVEPDRSVTVAKSSFSTMAKGLAELATWLRDAGVETVGMEATGVYWKPVVRHEAPSNREEVQGLLRRTVAAVR
jgi:transposase